MNGSVCVTMEGRTKGCIGEQDRKVKQKEKKVNEEPRSTHMRIRHAKGQPAGRLR